MQRQSSSNSDQGSNKGEGDPEAAERFNTAEREFVESERGQQKIQKGAQVRPDEQADLANAERMGRERAKNDDSGAANK
ncbi:MAG: hypothetical protein M3O41_17860 [Pseudomonadota bacterium]|nr:hypothetical protein [Pseudomonadota bacterium]